MKTPPRASASWQEGGYRMEDSPCEHVEAVNARNDSGFRHPQDPEAWRDDPFRDEAVDEKLRSGRSADLDSRSSAFWIGPDKAPQEAEIERGRKKSTVLEKKPPSVNRRIFGIAIPVFLVLIALVFAGIRLFYSVRTITVVGNQRIPAERILELSGVRVGQNLLSLSDEKIAEGLKPERYLILVSVKKDQSSGAVTLYVREREHRAYLQYCGITYVLDGRGMVLEQDVEELESNKAEDDAEPEESLPPLKIEGMDIRSIQLGQVVALNKPEQLTIYINVAMELKALGLTEVVTELYVTSPTNLYLATTDGFSVHLGDSNRIHAKLRAMTLVQAELSKSGITTGTIDVARPAEPTYIPDGGAI